MLVTVAICTWNRARLLDRTLEGMRSLRIPEGVSWELLVVNNRCSDDTDSVIAGHAGRLPARRLFEPRQGHSHARNRAVAEARGDLLLWTDDDVLVGPDWLASYVEAARAYPEAAFFIGPVEPWYEVEPPAWLVRHREALRGVLVAAEFGDEERPYRPGDPAFGANMAFRRGVSEQYPADPCLGRVGDLLTGGDDTDLIARVHAAGGLGYCIPGARVGHFVPARRLTEDYVWRWFLGSGHTLVRRGEIDPGPTIGGAPRWAIRGYIEARARAAIRRPLRDERWLRAFAEAARLLGVIRESRAGRRACPLVAGETSASGAGTAPRPVPAVAPEPGRRA